MPWPSKYGTAASQAGLPPTPPPDRNATSHGVYPIAMGGRGGSLNAFAPYWNSVGFIPYSVPTRPGGMFSSGVFYPAVTDGTDRKELLLQARWPKAATINKTGYQTVNKTLISITIESRPQESVSWRTAVTTILFDGDTTVGRITSPFEAYSFPVAVGDEYRAFASYSTSTIKHYSPIQSSNDIDPAIRPCVYSFASKLGHSGFGSLVGVEEFKTAVSLLSASGIVRWSTPVVGSGYGTHRGNVKIYLTYADRLTQALNTRASSIAGSGSGNTITIFPFTQWV